MSDELCPRRFEPDHLSCRTCAGLATLRAELTRAQAEATRLRAVLIDHAINHRYSAEWSEGEQYWMCDLCYGTSPHVPGRGTDKHTKDDVAHKPDCALSPTAPDPLRAAVRELCEAVEVMRTSDRELDDAQRRGSDSGLEFNHSAHARVDAAIDAVLALVGRETR